MYAQSLEIQNFPHVSDFYASLIDQLHREVIEGFVENWGHILKKISQDGCRQSFKKLFSHFYPALLVHFQKSGISKQVASELTQECMLKIWNGAKTFDEDKASVSTWIYIIARNTKYDYFRKLKNDPAGPTSFDIYDCIDSLVSEDQDLETLVDINKLKSHLDVLPAEQRLVLEAMYFEGLSHQEIATSNQIPLGTVKSRIRLALSSVRKIMEDKIQ